jgi:HPt (histidine-containing phosphotransfer) domain-containing protein
MIIDMESIDRESSGLAAGRQINPDVLDLAALVKRCMGEASIAQKLLEMFGQQLAAVVEQVDRHLREGDFQRAAQIVHNLKGEAGNMSAVALHRAAGGLESVLKSLRPASADAAPLREELHRLSLALPLAVRSLDDWNRATATRS